MLTPRNWSRFILLLIFTVASLATAIYLHSRAFPIANVSFDVSRPDAGKKMATIIEGLGHSLEGYRSAIAFHERSTTKNFIDRQYGIKRLEEVEHAGLNLWYWTGRWFKPGQREEFSAWLSPDGHLVGFSHVIEEAAERPTVSEKEARTIAEEFLKAHFPRHPWAELKFVSESLQKRPARTDHTFTWERRDFRLGDAPYHLRVTIYGNEVGGYGEGLKVPEWWSRDFAKNRKVNELCEAIAGYALVPIFIGIFVVLIIGIKNGQIRWQRSIPWGWYLLLGATAIIGAINSFPEGLFSYATTQEWRAYLAETAFSTLREAIGVVGGFWLLFLVADRLYRQGLPHLLPFDRALGASALRDRRTVQALGMGIVFALFSLAYVSAFYVAGQHWGIWCPVHIDYAKTVGGWFPWVEPLKTGLFAAFGEEMLFRVIALVLIWRLVRVRWIAVVLSAAVWAFLHSRYPQMPGYIRGIELTIGGIIWTVVMLRYGIVSTLTAHYLYNCWLGSAILLQSASWGNKVGALIVSLWPVALFLWAWLRKAEAPETAQPEPHLSESAPAPPPLPLNAQPAFNFKQRRFTPKQRLLILAAAILAIGLMMVIPQAQEKINALGTIELSREQIIAKADELIRQRGINPDDYRRIVTLNSDTPDDTTYLLEHGSLDGIAQLTQTEWNELEWRIRYFQILQQEEITLYLDKQGQLLSQWPTIPREAPGAKLDRDAALARAKETLANAHKIDLSQETLISQRHTQQEQRSDWRFIFERNEFPWGEAKLRTSIRLQGDEAVNFNRYIKVPEAWELAREKSGWHKFAAEELETWTSLVTGVVVITYLVLLIRKNFIPWRLAGKIALFPLLLELISKINDIPWFYSNYSTTTTLSTYWITQLGGKVVTSLIGTYFGSLLLIGSALGAMRWAFNWTPKGLILWPDQRSERAQFWSSSLIIAFSSITLLASVSFISDTLSGTWFPAREAYFSYPEVNTLFPWLGSLTSSIESGFDNATRLALRAGFYFVIWRRYPKAAWTLFLIDPIVENLGADTVQRFLFDWSVETLYLLLTAWLVIKVWRFNAIAIFLTFMGQSLVGSITLYLTKGGPNYQGEALPLLLIPTAIVAWGLILHFSRKEGKDEANTQAEPQTSVSASPEAAAADRTS